MAPAYHLLGSGPAIAIEGQDAETLDRCHVQCSLLSSSTVSCLALRGCHLYPPILCLILLLLLLLLWWVFVLLQLLCLCIEVVVPHVWWSLSEAAHVKAHVCHLLLFLKLQAVVDIHKGLCIVQGEAWPFSWVTFGGIELQLQSCPSSTVLVGAVGKLLAMLLLLLSPVPLVPLQKLLPQ